MIRLFERKQQKKSQTKKVHPGELRIQKDMEELELPGSCTLDYPDENDVLNFVLIMKPTEGYWKGGTFNFSFHIPTDYPHTAPKVECKTKIYHPNIDLEGKVCLNVLRFDWKPVLTINTVIYGLQLLFLEPNPNDPLNHEAAELLKKDTYGFSQKVKRTMNGNW
ncbi:nedd8-conjugating enzyme ubc12-like-related [Anaeramoeba flamelloides]|uniref:Nedd8-conjugating enzyme ubc12-like-related n=1 Tax=Anaeramoeba flamelloides TaxID=1746091 RepID=A0AAV7ZQK2_9EUKA|nr:nedd8-conjugating enzyme ubc12-like-related [Anaeramoeba flamelloides]